MKNIKKIFYVLAICGIFVNGICSVANAGFKDLARGALGYVATAAKTASDWFSEPTIPDGYSKIAETDSFKVFLYKEIQSIANAKTTGIIFKKTTIEQLRRGGVLFVYNKDFIKQERLPSQREVRVYVVKPEERKLCITEGAFLDNDGNIMSEKRRTQVNINSIDWSTIDTVKPGTIGEAIVENMVK